MKGRRAGWWPLLAWIGVAACRMGDSRRDASADSLYAAGAMTNEPLPQLTLDSSLVWRVRADQIGLGEASSLGAVAIGDTTLIVADLGGGGIVRTTRGSSQAQRLARSGHGPGELDGPFEFSVVRDTIVGLGQPPLSSNSLLFIPLSSPGNATRTRVASDTVALVARSVAADWLFIQRGARGFSLSTPPAVGTWIDDSVTYGLMPRSDTPAAVAATVSVGCPACWIRDTSPIAPRPIAWALHWHRMIALRTRWPSSPAERSS